MKEIPAIVSPFLRRFPSYSIPETTKGVSVRLFIRSNKVTTEQYSFCFRLEKVQFSQLVCGGNGITQYYGNDTMDSRAIDFIEEVNIEHTAGIEVKSG